jgi:PAS domain S-box-containing protein
MKKKTHLTPKREKTRQGGKDSNLNNVHNNQTLKNAPKINSRKILDVLQKSENEKRALIEGLRDLITVRYLSPDFRIIWTNADPIQELETGDDTVSPVYCYTLLRGRTEPCPNCEAREALERECFYENKESKPAGGRYFIARGIPVKDKQGKVLGVIHIALNITKYKETEDGLRITNAFLYSLLRNSPTPICVSDLSNRITTVNDAWKKTLGFSETQTVGKCFHDIFPKEIADRINHTNKQIIESNTSFESEESIECLTGLHHFHTVRFPLQDASGRSAAIGTILLDVTARKHAEQELTEREAELRTKSLQLEEMNTALRVLLKQREGDQRELEERIMSNIKELVLPYLRKLKGTHLSEVQASYMEVAETHLQEITAPFLRQTVSQYPHITTKELQVATLVREGRSNKEIADLMHVSLNTIEIHRYNLRKKLGMQNKKMNLRSYLLSLNGLPDTTMPD